MSEFLRNDDQLTAPPTTPPVTPRVSAPAWATPAKPGRTRLADLRSTAGRHAAAARDKAGPKAARLAAAASAKAAAARDKAAPVANDLAARASARAAEAATNASSRLEAARAHRTDESSPHAEGPNAIKRPLHKPLWAAWLLLGWLGVHRLLRKDVRGAVRVLLISLASVALAWAFGLFTKFSAIWNTRRAGRAFVKEAMGQVSNFLEVYAVSFASAALVLVSVTVLISLWIHEGLWVSRTTRREALEFHEALRVSWASSAPQSAPQVHVTPAEDHQHHNLDSN